MQIIVNIPDEDYQIALTKLMLEFKGCSITTLPKGHGRLIDADALPKSYFEPISSDSEYVQGFGYYRIKDIVNAPTIIEAESGKDCKMCRHSEETDGSNCYECVKGLQDNFEADKGEEE